MEKSPRTRILQLVGLFIYLFVVTLVYNLWDNMRIDTLTLMNDLELTTELKVRQLLIVSHARSGSSFVGDLFNNRLGTMYWYEPLYSIQPGVDSNSTLNPRNKEAISILTSIMECDIQNLPSRVRLTQHLYRSNSARTLLRTGCRLVKGTLTDVILSQNCTDAFRSFCRSSPLVVAKVIRAGRFVIGQMLDRFPELKVIYLTRDPRGWATSRLKLWWRNSTRAEFLKEVAGICADIYREVVYIKSLPDNQRSRVLTIRYEDLALNPEQKVTEICDHVNINVTNSMFNWLAQNTGKLPVSLKGSPYSTQRDSAYTVYKWREEMPGNLQRQVYQSCRQSSKLLNYTEEL